LKLQDIPGSSGIVPVGQAWKIVELDSSIASNADGVVFSPDHWKNLLFEGVLGDDGILALTDEQQKKLYQLVSCKPNHIWVVSGLTAMPISQTNWSTTSNQPNPKRILDSLNFASNGALLDTARESLLAEISKMDGDVASVNSLKKNIDI
jgi:hypothetical protein